MTVGELRKALGGISDDLPVNILDELWYHSPSEAHIKQMCKTHDEDWGDYIEPNDDGRNRYKGEPTYPVFVIE